MNATPTKEIAAARDNPARSERTVANELPQELSRLSAQCGFSDVATSLRDCEQVKYGGSRAKVSHSKKAASVAKTRQLTVTTTTGFMDDGHPTILAAARGLIRPR